MLNSQDNLDASLKRLVALDGRLGLYVETCQPIALRKRPTGLGGLLQIILAQQVSVASANAIWQRFEAQFGDMDVEKLLAANDEDFRACSLSRPKMKAVRQIATAVQGGYSFNALEALSDEDAKENLVGLYGVGPWTADIYLLFCQGRPDIFPSGDLALQVVASHLQKLENRMSEADVANLAKQWSPERGAAAYLLWAMYRELKSGKSGVI